jgi:hypothetical protein
LGVHCSLHPLINIRDKPSRKTKSHMTIMWF